MCEVIASSNTFRVKQKRLHLGIIDEVMTLVRDIEGCGMIMERVGGLRSGVPAPEEWSVLRTFRTRSIPLLALNSRLYSKLKFYSGN